jgi:DNA-binding XRE family transcriptional regulator
MNGRKKVVVKESRVKSLTEKMSDYTIAEIMKRLAQKKTRSFNIEQKLLVLKLLQLNEMDYTQTAKQVGIVRQTISVWEKQYGAVMFNSKPAVMLAEKIENDLAVIQRDTMKNTYRTINLGLNKCQELIGKATSPRQLYAVKEAILASVEVIKVEKLILPDQPQKNDFFMQIHNLMINNYPHLKDNGNKD